MESLKEKGGKKNVCGKVNQKFEDMEAEKIYENIPKVTESVVAKTLVRI